LERRAVLLAWATITWNVVEAVVAIAAGAAANSIALVGFGLDSPVEVMSAVVIVWQFRGFAEERERRALKVDRGQLLRPCGVGRLVPAIIDLPASQNPGRRRWASVWQWHPSSSCRCWPVRSGVPATRWGA
jgi:hypothetical protein